MAMIKYGTVAAEYTVHRQVLQETFSMLSQYSD